MTNLVIDIKCIRMPCVVIDKCVQRVGDCLRQVFMKDTSAVTATPPISALGLAQHVLAWLQDHGYSANNLKLQKLLYYCQAWHLAFFNAPIFAEAIEAWVNGPVVPIVYQRYKSCGYMFIRNSPVSVIKPIAPQFTAHIQNVLEVYAKYSGSDLSTMTHLEDPWVEARGSLDPKVNCNNVISHTSMALYYRHLLYGQAPGSDHAFARQ